ncbi:MAG: hypothetical protein HQ542_05225, partial [Bacteroidia bacterium]|nr:hypothetical protein [Bacteroidia bacterium]
MKKVLLKPVMLTFMAFSMTLLFSGSLVAQDTVVKKPHKVMKIKVDMDEDGESFTIDTSFVIDEDFTMEQFQEAMKEYEVQMEEMEHYLKEIEIDFEGEEMEKAMKEMKVSLRKAHRDMPGKKNFHQGVSGP